MDENQILSRLSKIEIGDIEDFKFLLKQDKYCPFYFEKNKMAQAEKSTLYIGTIFDILMHRNVLFMSLNYKS